MAVSTNRIDVNLTAEQITAINTALQALEDALPFLVSLEPAERRRLLKLGAKSEAFVRQAHQAGRENTQLMPPALSIASLDRDELLRETLLPVYQKLSHLTTKIGDTNLVAGSDLMNGAMTVYRALKAHGRGEGLDVVTRELGRRFDRPSRNEEPTPGGTGGAGTGSTQPGSGTPPVA